MLAITKKRNMLILTNTMKDEPRLKTKCGICTSKIDVQGPDAAEFLERLYVNRWQSLAVGKARYGVMLRDDGFVYDDGTTSRLGEHHFLMTTTTSNASSVLSHLEYHLQVVWPELRVSVTDVTDCRAALAVAGPKSRDLLEAIFGRLCPNPMFANSTGNIDVSACQCPIDVINQGREDIECIGE